MLPKSKHTPFGTAEWTLVFRRVLREPLGTKQMRMAVRCLALGLSEVLMLKVGAVQTGSLYSNGGREAVTETTLTSHTPHFSK